jgi:2,3-bisphosphoglycerate-dependent phosphoglycerate mutase
MAEKRTRPKHLVVLVCAVIVAVIGWWCFRPSTTVRLVRHTEKATQTADPTPTTVSPVPHMEKGAQTGDSTPTTVLLVRHAEAAAQTQDPSLSADGLARAQALVHVASDASVTAIYATQFLRTQQTVQPLATYLGLPVNEVNADDVEGLVDQVLSDHAGKVVLIAGHSPTVPAIIREFGGDPMPPIAGNEFDNLFIVTVHGVGEAKVVHLNYGDPD